MRNWINSHFDTLEHTRNSIAVISAVIGFIAFSVAITVLLHYPEHHKQHDTQNQKKLDVRNSIRSRYGY